MNQEIRALVYSRVPNDARKTVEQRIELQELAEKDGCTVFGYCEDYCHGWLHRGGYRKLLHLMKKGEVQRVYITRMGSISHSERELFRFFKVAMKYGITVYASEVCLYNYVNSFKIGKMVEHYAAKHGLPFPWANPMSMNRMDQCYEAVR